MGVPVSQMMTVAAHVLGNVARGNRRYPLVLMLEPLFRCNLACAGCGKIQYPAHVLKRQLSAADCFRAVEECGAPMVSVAGGEPLMHPEIGEIASGLVARKRYVYLCTNALLLEQKLDEGLFRPSKHLSFSVHLDGPRDEHDFAVCREGTHEKAVAAIRRAVAEGYRVTTNTTVFDGVDPARMRTFFDEVMELGVEGMMISPGYSYQKAPDQEHFLRREKTHLLFRGMLEGRKRSWKFNQSPLFLEFLQGRIDFECTPWGNPTYNVFGWQKPCYLLQEGYADTFAELMSGTDWDAYGRKSGNEKCADCMVHCGHEPSSVHHAFTSITGMARMARGTLQG
jgi:hopanoid biosynthesis associated radical SAM protein HpnH